MSYHKCFRIIKNFITQQESDFLVKEATRKLSRIYRNRPYEETHFDSVITGYKECQYSDYAPIKDIIDRMASAAQDTLGRDIKFQVPHILELRDGNSGIGAHVDHIQAFGSVIGCLSLISPAVLVFRHKDTKEQVFRALVDPTDFYIQL